MKRLVSSALVAVSLMLLQTPASGQLLLVDLGDVPLQPNESGQVRDFVIQNTGEAVVENIFGINFALQVGDGTSGPEVQAVNLYAADSVFRSFAVNQVDQGSSSRVLFVGIDGGGVALSIPPLSSTLLARVTFDTTGIGLGAGPWTISANDVGPLNSDSHYVLVGGASRPIETFVDGTLTVVPEPTCWGLATGTLMLAAALFRGTRARQAQAVSPGRPMPG